MTNLHDTHFLLHLRRCHEGLEGLTERHEMASILGHGTSNRPLLGFVKRHQTEVECSPFRLLTLGT